MLEQYFAMKARHPDAILLARVGDFYEAYGDDATTIAQALQIALTSKEAGGGQRVAMAGVPHHALDGYLAKLVQQQRIVALAEQMEVPVPNRLTRRDVVRVVTPGTLIEETLLERASNNYLTALTVGGEAIGLALGGHLDRARAGDRFQRRRGGRGGSGRTDTPRSGRNRRRRPRRDSQGGRRRVAGGARDCAAARRGRTARARSGRGLLGRRVVGDGALARRARRFRPASRLRRPERPATRARVLPRANLSSDSTPTRAGTST